MLELHTLQQCVQHMQSVTHDTSLGSHPSCFHSRCRHRTAMTHGYIGEQETHPGISRTRLGSRDSLNT